MAPLPIKFTEQLQLTTVGIQVSLAMEIDTAWESGIAVNADTSPSKRQ